ncbi:MAG: SAM-dependent methyltransferase [Streptosporangiales bacterium]|nr:SAM-dependent methyltransferase [Streptosporangiales bacterium]
MSSDLPEELDITVPNAARMYDYLLGGKDHFEADRKAAERLVSLVPAVPSQVRENRGFLRRAVRYVAAQGVDQFLDVGAGLPTQDAVHEVAHEVTPGARVAYVDYDPMVVLHGNALLTEPDRSVVTRGDVRDPGAILTDPKVTAHLDFSRPVAVTLVAIMHFVDDASGPLGLVARFRDALAPGSYLVLSHVTRDNIPDHLAKQAVRLYDDASAPLLPRTRDQVARFFDGFEVVEPGIVHDSDWRSDTADGHDNPPRLGWAGVGVKH